MTLAQLTIMSYHILIITDGSEACNDKDICSLSRFIEVQTSGFSLYCYYSMTEVPLIAINANTQQLTKDNDTMLFSCIAIPEYHSTQTVYRDNHHDRNQANTKNK